MWHRIFVWFASNDLTVLGLIIGAAGAYYAFAQVRLIKRQNAANREAKAKRPNLYISLLNQRTFVRGTDVQFAEMALQVTNSGNAAAHGFNWVLNLEPHMREQVQIFREDETEVFPELSFEGTDNGYSPLFQDASIQHVFPHAYIPIGRMRINAAGGQLPSFTMSSRVMHDESRNKSWDKINLMNLGNNTYAIQFELGELV